MAGTADESIGHIRYWERIKPTSQTRLADDVVDAIFSDVFQGKRDGAKEHARGVAYKAVRQHAWPYFEECVEKAVEEQLADARREERKRTLIEAADTVENAGDYGEGGWYPDDLQGAAYRLREQAERGDD